MSRQGCGNFETMRCVNHYNFFSFFSFKHMKITNPKRIEKLKPELAKDIEKEKYKKLAVVIIEITERLVKNFKN